MKTNDSRKLVLAVQDRELLKKLKGLLSAEHIRVEYLPDLSSAEPEDIEADVVVLRAESLDRGALPNVLTSGQENDSPGVVVLGDGESSQEVGLVAAGASAVLDSAGKRGQLAEQLVELAEAEADGGLHGPEAGGSVAEPKLADFHSSSSRMRDFLGMVRRVASSDSTLLIMGETGVGKERLARAIHSESERSKGPFVAVNCGALPENLLESELFGHQKGAFTGATSARQGHFEAANGGTVFLDEVGEMAQHLQVKLLTVLQRHEIQPLGAQEPKSIDVRVMTATNRDIVADVAEGRFREDLFFRLNVVSLVIPPLRDRLEDLPWLLGRFLRHFVETHDRPTVTGVDQEAMEVLQRYPWPGNVRELVNVIERAVLLCEGERITANDLPLGLRQGQARSASSGTDAASSELLALPLQEARRRTVEEFERVYIEHHLRRNPGALGDVARDAGINPRTLYEKMRRLGLSKEDYR
ncbi:MAG: two-component system response regulator AtoC [Planctomycetota bacterium]|jgi:two-component system response regulator AtoC